MRRPEGGQEAAAHGPRGWGRTRGAGAHGCAVNRRNVVAVSVSPRTRRGVPPTRVVSLGPEVLEARETVVLHAKRTKRAGDWNRKNRAPVGIDTEVTIGGQSYVLRAVAVHVGDFADSGHWKAYRHVSSTTAPTVAAWCPPSSLPSGRRPGAGAESRDASGAFFLPLCFPLPSTPLPGSFREVLPVSSPVPPPEFAILRLQAAVFFRTRVKPD